MLQRDPKCCDQSINIAQATNLKGLQFNWLSVQEKKTLEKKKRQKSVDQFISSRFLAKSLALGEFGAHWKDVSARFDEKAGMFLVGGNQRTLYQCAISHSEDLVALINNGQYKAAIDIQAHNKSVETIEKLAGLLPSEEQELVKKDPAQFFQIWVLKEAYAKLHNGSILDALPNALTTIRNNCFLQYIPINENYSVAVALPEPPTNPFTLNFWSIDFPSLNLKKSQSISL